MKTGIIFYVTEGKDLVAESWDWRRERERFKADAVSMATSEFEIAYAWWHMLTRGIQQISCMTARLDATDGRIHSLGRSLRVCG